MFRVLIVLAPAAAIALIWASAWYLHRRWQESRLLKKDPRILGEKGRLARRAAENLYDTRLQLQAANTALMDVQSALAALLVEAQSHHLNVEVMAHAYTALDKIATQTRLPIEDGK